uniref:Uncharacterized protein n=1 Tax=Setaria viridis TaxID=4556 RepID=A0A4U6U4C0_SETVI|nr:hypothetical protein SEVIR_6G160650v2 [Setaria viridis]
MNCNETGQLQCLSIVGFAAAHQRMWLLMSPTFRCSLLKGKRRLSSLGQSCTTRS